MILQLLKIFKTFHVVARAPGVH